MTGRRQPEQRLSAAEWVQPDAQDEIRVRESLTASSIPSCWRMA
jgi:hypothetical protein